MTQTDREIAPAYRVGDLFFASKEEAEKYVEEQRQEDGIERFLASRTWKRGRETVARNVISAYLGWVAAQRPDQDIGIDH